MPEEDRTGAEEAIREDLVLHQVARELASADDVPGVLARIAELARVAADADASYLERIDLRRDEVEVMAATGPTAPPVGTRIPYPGSLAQDAVEGDRPEVVTPEEMAKRPIASTLASSCADCSALVVPLISERDAVGALILLRAHGRAGYADEEIARIRVFADMAALALRRVLSEAEAMMRLQQLEESRRRFQLLVESVRDYAFFMLDADGRVASWNPGAEHVSGYSSKEAIGQHFSIFHTEEDRSRRHADRALAEAVERGVFQEEGWRVRKDGGRFWAHVTITAVRDDQGRLLGFANVAHDLSEHRRADDELRASRERYRALYEDNPTIFITTDRAGTIVSINRFGAEYLGYAPADLTGTQVTELIHPDDLVRFQELSERCFARPGEVEIMEFRKLRRDGAVLWVRERGRVVPGPGGQPVLLTACEDITSRVLTEQALRESEARFRQIAENIREVFWVSDPTYTQLSYVSPGYPEVWGRTAESLYADPRSFLEAVHPDDRARVEAALPRMADEFDQEFRIIRPDGETRWIRSRAFPVRDAEGNIVRVVGVGEDITDRRRLLEAERTARGQVTSILESITDAFFALDREWHFTYMNHGTKAAIRAILGSDPEAAMGRSFWEVVPDFRGTRFEAEYRRAMETQQPAHFEEYSEALGVWFEVHAYPSPDALSVYFRDVTERRRAENERARLLEAAEAARKEAERRARDEEALRRAAEAVSAQYGVEEVIHQVAVSALDATQADGAYVERLDLMRDCVEVVAVAGAQVPAVGAQVRYADSVTRRAVERGEPLLVGCLGDVEVTLPGGMKETCGRCSAVVVPLVDADAAVGALILLRTPDRPAFSPGEMQRAGTFARLAFLAFRRAQILEESERGRQELEKVMESRARLIRGFSHDVKNPLGAADGYLELMEEGIMGELAPKQRESVARVRRSIRSALSLINDLVELARAEAGQIEIAAAPVPIGPLTREIVEDFRAQAATKELGIDSGLPNGLPTIVTDGERVRQVLGNLLSNAVKYTPEGGRIFVEAALRTGRRDDDPAEWVVVHVRDTGPGIPADKQEEIFHEFTRLDPAATHGAGLGLAISRRIARALGGDITVQSRAGNGAEFSFWLPASQGQEP